MISSADAYVVRPLEGRDLGVLKRLLPEWTPANDSAALEEHCFRVLVKAAGGDEELAGIAEYQRILDEGHLLGIAIAPALQKRGLATRLLNAVMEEMRGEGCTRCLLEVRRSNVAAQALYVRAQFRQDGIRKNYYPTHTPAVREDALLYSRAL